MKTNYLLTAAALFLPAVSIAQTAPVAAGFQQVQTLSVTGGDLVILPTGGGGAGSFVTGKPYSATVVTHTVQMLSDGSQIENTRTQVVYRDDQGRTRTETNDGKEVSITDRAAGIHYLLDTAGKTAREVHTTALPAIAVRAPSATSTEPSAAPKRSNQATEDLGAQSFYGVPAHGTRTTITIPAGAVGNNRDLKTVTETWESKDLNLVVKRVTTDPRFGATTYELTNISTSAPDPALFRVPAGYTVEQIKRD